MDDLTRRLAVVLACTILGPSTGTAQQASERYDVYLFGVRAAALSVDGASSARTCRIRRRDVAATGGDEARVTETVVGNMAVHHSRLHPSQVVLPVLPKP